MRIGVISTPHESTPPRRYGGVERVVHYLVEGLVKRGHEVILFATGDSSTSAELRYLFESPRRPYSEYSEIMHLERALSELKDLGVDFIHNHCNGIGSMRLLERASREVPLLTTLHGIFRRRQLSAAFEGLAFAAISNRQMALHPFLRFVGRVYNGIEVSEYPFRKDKEDYLLYVGVMAPHKGPHIAINVAKSVRAKLILVGKVEAIYWDYFEKWIKPHLSENVKFLGEVSEAEKRALMAGAKCVLFTSIHEEPFGLVMVEAMACGTPVIGFRKGAVPEVIADGVSGYVVNNLRAMREAVRRVESIEPKACRSHVEKEFKAERMVEEYLGLYGALLREPLPILEASGGTLRSDA
ncbi:MAG: glycosyltransferase family 4 protein [Candidatus Bathyarchaeia archaeon]